ncbi:hypothetical protein QQS21_008650 [Conoideocrella luteorostrata]|uniref:Uncharacterized protein n=1 Tax=Conoideocrella luteorostrata TaxID=1105319 RepID=A0AAJ0CMV7_9HYPO|nr:hypothetical protein QQS21_008650 [Conoideocrella luteorostrata]
MTKGGELLSNRQDLLDAAKPLSSIEHISLSPTGGWFIRFTDGSAQISSKKSLSKAFRDLAYDYMDMYSTSRQSRRKIKSVVFGANGAVMLSMDNNKVRYDLISETLKSSIPGKEKASKKASGVSLGKSTTLCPWNRDYYFLEVESAEGPSRYIYKLPPNQIPPDLVDSLVQNRVPPATLQSMQRMPQSIPQSTISYGESSNHGMPSTVMGKSNTVQSLLDKFPGINNTLHPNANCGTYSQPAPRPVSYHAGMASSPGFVYPPPISPAQPVSQHLQPIQQQTSFQNSHQIHEPPPAYTAYPTPPTQPQAWQHPPPPQHWQGQPIPPRPVQDMAMTKPLICEGCEIGIIPDDFIYHCTQCSENGLSYCESCHATGRMCTHTMQRVKVVPDKKLSVRDKNGDWGFGLCCDKCSARIRKDDFVWYCDRCTNQDYCAGCWQNKTKRCKHGAKGKVKLKQVGRKRDSTEQIVDTVDVVSQVLGFS